MQDRIPVVMIAGDGRSGSTVLGRLLGQIDGWFFVGETWGLRHAGIEGQHLCGCGEKLPACPVWGPVIQEVFEGRGDIDPALLFDMSTVPLKNRHLILRDEAAVRAAIDGHPEWMESLRRTITALARISGARVIVDSSKHASYIRFLAATGLVDLHIVHLVRDGRAVTWSWAHRIREDYLAPRTPLRAALDWSRINLAVERQWGFRGPASLFVRYEDFVAEPAAVLSRIAAWAGEADPDLPFLDGNMADLAPHHAFFANPGRHRMGPTPLRADDEWRRKMSWRERRMVEALTWPFLLRYGYPLFA